MELNDVVHIPFQDLGALMGFEILKINEKDLEAMNPLDPAMDVYEITSPKKWIPKRFRQVNKTTGEPQTAQQPACVLIETLGNTCLLYTSPSPRDA